MRSNAVEERRLQILQFLRNREEPAMSAEVAMAIKELPRATVQDLRTLAKRGWVRAKKFKAVSMSMQRRHTTTFCAWTLTEVGQAQCSD